MEIEEEGSTSRLLSDERKWLIIISYRYFNLTQSEICEIFGYHKGTVSKILTKFRQQNDVNNNHRNSGRISMIDEYPDLQQCVENAIEENPTISLSGIKEYLNKLNYGISVTNVFNIMQNLNMAYKKTKNEHLLTEENKQKCVEYCKYWINKPFKGIWFSDECKFQLDNQDGYVWCKKGTNQHIQQLKQRSYSNRQAHAWGAISLDGRSELYFPTHSVNSDEYINCLEESLIPATKEYYKRRKIRLQQDGARAHVSQQTMEYCEEREISIIQSPAWSPDLSPIELIWAYIKRQWFKIKLKEQIQTQEQIQQFLQQIWVDIPQEQIECTINHIKKVMKKVIDSEGNYLV